MAVLPPQLHTYHCICTSLLLSSTHVLSTLPRRAPPSLDNAYILPVPSRPPSFAPSRSPSPNADESRARQNDNDGGDDEEEEQEELDRMQGLQGVEAEDESKDMPPSGYSVLLGMLKDARVTIIRREDGFERRLLWRCMRCRLVVGYEIAASGTSLADGAGDRDGTGKQNKDGYEGKVIYLLPNGILATEVMVKGGKIGEGDLDMSGEGVGVWE